VSHADIDFAVFGESVGRRREENMSGGPFIIFFSG